MSDLLGIATTGLLASQRQLDTVGNNIANASLPSYNREETILGTNPTVKIGNSYLGGGVYSQGTQRIVNNYITQAMWAQQSSLGESDAYHEIIDQIDRLFAEPNLGLSESIAKVFNALQDVSHDPSSIPSRQNFISQNNILQSKVNELHSQVFKQFDDINEHITEYVTNINSLTEKIAEVNFKIQNLGSTTYLSAPNQLLDLRESLILELSQYVNITTASQENGALNVYMGSGQSAVIGNTVTLLSTQNDPNDPYNLSVVANTGQATQDISNYLPTGKLGGLLEARNTIIPQALNAIGRIAITFALTLNEAHTKGIDLDGNMGVSLCTDPNEYNTSINRVISNTGNSGTAIFSAAINPIAMPNKPSVVFSQASDLVNSSTLTNLISGMLKINEITIPTTSAGDDTLSSTDNAASAIAIAKQINTKSNAIGVVATAEPNVLYLGTFTPGVVAAGNLRLNGVDILSTGADEETLLQDINSYTVQTGITAVGDGSLHIRLMASDGRNIQIEKTSQSAGATFTNFDLSALANYDQVVKASVRLESLQNSPITISGGTPSSFGFTAGTTAVSTSSLTNNDYQMTYDGSLYYLSRLPDKTLIASASSPEFSVEGFTLSLESGTARAGDSFIIQPTRYGARDYSFTLVEPTASAMASPIMTDASLDNRGTAKISFQEITDASGLPVGSGTVLGNAFSKAGALTPPIMIKFSSATTYQVYNIANGLPGEAIGPEQSYQPTSTNNDIFPISGVIDTLNGAPSYVYDPGYRIRITGVAHMGDTFTVDFNDNPYGDNRNAITMLALQFSKTMLNQSATYQDSYAQLVSSVGAKASQASINLESGNTLMQAIQTKRNEVSGVNVDEEAANLLKYEQIYQANAQVIVIARGVFDSLLRAIGGA